MDYPFPKEPGLSDIYLHREHHDSNGSDTRVRTNVSRNFRVRTAPLPTTTLTLSPTLVTLTLTPKKNPKPA